MGGRDTEGSSAERAPARRCIGTGWKPGRDGLRQPADLAALRVERVSWQGTRLFFLVRSGPSTAYARRDIRVPRLQGSSMVARQLGSVGIISPWSVLQPCHPARCESLCDLLRGYA